MVSVLSQLSGQDRSSLAVAGATLAMVAVFQPAPPPRARRGRPPLQPASLRRGPDRGGVHPSPRPDRPGHAARGVAGRWGPNHGANNRIALAATRETFMNVSPSLRPEPSMHLFSTVKGHANQERAPLAPPGRTPSQPGAELPGRGVVQHRSTATSPTKGTAPGRAWPNDCDKTLNDQFALFASRRSRAQIPSAPPIGGFRDRLCC
jgi:hypothetical protein